jgi:hypothetical protein
VIRGKRANVWSPNAVLDRGVPCRGVIANGHGLGREDGCRDQHSRREGQFGHLFLDMMAEVREMIDLPL